MLNETTGPKLLGAMAAQQGLLGITIPEADGGQGGTLMDAVLAIEQVAAACPRSADVIQAGNFGRIRTFAERRFSQRPPRPAQSAAGE